MALAQARILCSHKSEVFTHLNALLSLSVVHYFFFSLIFFQFTSHSSSFTSQAYPFVSNYYETTDKCIVANCRKRSDLCLCRFSSQLFKRTLSEVWWCFAWICHKRFIFSISIDRKQARVKSQQLRCSMETFITQNHFDLHKICQFSVSQPVHLRFRL